MAVVSGANSPEGRGFHGTCVLHQCDVRSCVNPEHLYLGTHAQNMRDMDARGRRRNGTTNRGEAVWTAKVTASQVKAIRRAKGPRRAIAERYGIGVTQVGKIKNRRQWAWLA